MLRIGSPNRFSVYVQLLAVLIIAALTPSGAAAQTFGPPSAYHVWHGHPAFWDSNLTPAFAAQADFDGDGDSDIVVADGSQPTNLRLLLRNAAGALVVQNPVTPSGPCPGSTCVTNTNRVRAADVNGDGRMDIITSNNHSANLSVILNAGNIGGVPAFTTVNNYPIPSGARSVAVGDLNNDGKLDLVGGDANLTMWVFLGTGTGTFGAGTAFSDGGNNHLDTAIADLNGDGNNDVVVGNRDSGGGEISVFLGNGTGALIPSARYGGANGNSLAIGDFTGDGLLDVAATRTATGDSIALYPGTGGGLLGVPTMWLTGGTSANYLAAADFNGDGNLDLAASNSSTGRASVLLGDGAGSFGPATLFPAAATSLINVPNQILVGDVNGDGKPDLTTIQSGSDNVVEQLNTTVFAPSLPTQTLTILGGNGGIGEIAANVEYYNPVLAQWQPSYLVGTHPWGQVTGTSSWINYKPSNGSDPGAGPSTNQTLWFLYRVRFTVPADAVDPKMTFSVKADNFVQVGINGLTTGGSTRFINNANMPNVIEGQADGLNADAVFSQAVVPGENTITLNVGDWGGLNGFNFRIDLTMKSSEGIEIVPVNHDTTAPAISAPADITAEATSNAGVAVAFTATATDDVDGAVPVAADPASGSTFPIGVSTVSLTASDAAGNDASASFTVTVRDTIAPVLSVPGNIVAEATSAAGAEVTYVAATATDAVGVTSIQSNPPSGSTFPLGPTTVTSTARDAAGNTGAADFTVTVVDTTAPALAGIAPSQGSLWPPNHQMVAIDVSALVTDVVGVTSLKITAVTSSEPDNGLGDGDTVGDVVITGPLTVNLRAERAAKGNGRTYTITVEARDAAGNTSTGTCTVLVPKSQGKK